MATVGTHAYPQNFYMWYIEGDDLIIVTDETEDGTHDSSNDAFHNPTSSCLRRGCLHGRFRRAAAEPLIPYVVHALLDEPVRVLLLGQLDGGLLAGEG